MGDWNNHCQNCGGEFDEKIEKGGCVCYVGVVDDLVSVVERQLSELTSDNRGTTLPGLFVLINRVNEGKESGESLVLNFLAENLNQLADKAMGINVPTPGINPLAAGFEVGDNIRFVKVPLANGVYDLKELNSKRGWEIREIDLTDYRPIAVWADDGTSMWVWADEIAKI